MRFLNSLHASASIYVVPEISTIFFPKILELFENFFSWYCGILCMYGTFLTLFPSEKRLTNSDDCGFSLKKILEQRKRSSKQMGIIFYSEIREKIIFLSVFTEIGANLLRSTRYDWRSDEKKILEEFSFLKKVVFFRKKVDFWKDHILNFSCCEF